MTNVTKKKKKKAKTRSQKIRTVLLRIRTQVFGGNLLFACFILYLLIPIYFAVEEAIDSDENQSDGFGKDGFDGSGPTARVRQLPALVLGVAQRPNGAPRPQRDMQDASRI